MTVFLKLKMKKQSKARSHTIENLQNNDILSTTYSKLIGNTPVVKLKKLSQLLKRNVLVKVCDNAIIFAISNL